MKKLNKILSSVLAASMVISCCAINAFAASKTHTVTITPSKTEALVAGTDTVTVTITLDDTENLQACGYRLVYDTNAFDIDETKGWMSMKDYQMHQNYIDQTWYDQMKSDPFGSILSTLSISEDKAAGTITFGCAGNMGIPAAVKTTNYTIGKFTFTVKANAADGDYTFTLTDDETKDGGENAGAALDFESVTVTVGEPAPAKTTPAVTISEKTAGTTQGFLATCVVDSSKNYPVNGITINFANNKDDMKGLMAYTFTKVEAGTIKYAVNVENVPEGTDISATGTASVVK